MSDSLLAAVTSLAGRPVAGKLVEEAGLGAEDIGSSPFLEGCLAVRHDLLAGGAGDLRRLSCRRCPCVFVDGRRSCRVWWSLTVVVVRVPLRLAGG